MRILILGAEGLVGSALRPELAERGHSVDGRDLPGCNVADPASLAAAAGEARPDWIVNLAAITDVDGCEKDPVRAALVNGVGAGHAARLAAECGARFLQVSTDYVFDGRKGAPYLEGDPPAPLSAYGRSKLAGERAAAAALPADRLLVVRGQSLYGAGRKSFPDAILAAAAAKPGVPVVTDQSVSPTWAPDFARGVADLLERGVHGIVHLSALGSCTWNEFARAVLEDAGLDPARIVPTTAAALARPAARPAYSVYDLGRFEAATGRLPRPWREQLRSYLAATGRRP